MPAGRPSGYSPEVTAEICSRIAEGQSLRTICADEAMPGMRTVFQWLADHQEFQQQYARAREAQADAFAEEILEIADDASNDWMERLDEDSKSIGWQLNGEHVQRSKLRVDSRKWLASKMAPKRYGEKLELAGDPKAPLVPVLNVSVSKRGD